MTRPTIIGLELLVENLRAAVDVLSRALGCELVWEGRSADIDADAAVLDAGAITITLLEATSTGGVPLPDSTPRLTQLVFGGAAESTEESIRVLQSLGVSVAGRGSNRPHVPPGVARGILGSATALVLTTVELVENDQLAPVDAELDG